MGYGSPLSISMDNFTPDFMSAGTPTSYNQPPGLEIFDTHKIFNFAEFSSCEANYKQVILPEEDRDDQGNVGCFYLHKEFQMSLVYTYVNDEHMQKVISNIPHADTSFEVYVVAHNSG